MARAPKAPAIRFTADFDHVEVGRTVAYKAGHEVAKPSQALLDAAAGRFEDVTAAELEGDGE